MLKNRRKNLNVIFTIFFFVLVSGCLVSKKYDKTYIDKSGDSVYIQFMGVFENDSLIIYQNDKIVFSELLNSGNDSKSTDGDYIVLENIGNVTFFFPQSNELYKYHSRFNTSVVQVWYGWFASTRSESDTINFYIEETEELIEVE